MRHFDGMGGADRDAFAMAGALALTIALGHVLLPFAGESYEWAQHLLLGVAAPPAIWLLGRARAPRALRWTLAGIGIAALLGYVAGAGRWIAFPLGAVQVALSALVVGERPRLGDLLAAGVAWGAFASLGRAGRPDLFARYLGQWQGAPAAIKAVAGSCIVASLALRRARRNERRTWSRLVTPVALALLALESLRVDDLFDFGSVHHWGVFVAPAEAVRQGGWLLWDVPATYGPLSTLTIAAMPTASTWDGFFLLNAAACFVSTALLFTLLRQEMHAALALLLALCGALWLPGAQHGPFDTGVLITPNAGPFRFVWCQVLLVIAASRPRDARTWIAGCVLWLVGCLWSFESAVYCSFTWLPAYLLLVWSSAPAARWRWAALPPALAATALLLVEVYYRARLGHGPDWYAYVEASLGVRGGILALPIAPWGPVAVLLLLWWAAAAATSRVLAGASTPSALASACAALGFLWATSSYFVGRSHVIIVTDLLPSLLLAALVVRRELRACAARDGTAVETALATMFVAVLLLALQDPGGWIPKGPIGQRWGVAVDHRRPTLDPEQLALMRAIGVGPGSAIAFVDVNVMPAWPPEAGTSRPDRVWLPIQPLAELDPVSDERRALYVRRFVERAGTDGWLIGRAAMLPGFVQRGAPWLFETLARTYRAAQTVTVGPWQAMRYERIDR